MDNNKLRAKIETKLAEKRTYKDRLFIDKEYALKLDFSAQANFINAEIRSLNELIDILNLIPVE